MNDVLVPFVDHLDTPPGRHRGGHPRRPRPTRPATTSTACSATSSSCGGSCCPRPRSCAGSAGTRHAGLAVRGRVAGARPLRPPQPHARDVRQLPPAARVGDATATARRSGRPAQRHADDADDRQCRAAAGLGRRGAVGHELRADPGRRGPQRLLVAAGGRRRDDRADAGLVHGRGLDRGTRRAPSPSSGGGRWPPCWRCPCSAGSCRSRSTAVAPWDGSAASQVASPGARWGATDRRN